MGCICSKINNHKGNEENVAGSDLNCTSPESLLLRALEVSELQKEQISDIWMYISTNWHDIRQNSSLVEAIKNTAFVTNADGGLCKPKDLFDPGDALVTSLFSHDQAHKFPGGRFVSDGWLNILRDAGLGNTRDSHILIQCARRIEFLGANDMKKNQVSLEIWSLAKTLIKTMLKNVDLLHDHNFCSVFGKISCIPAERNFNFSRKGKDGGIRVVCRYNEMILLKDWALAWTAAPVLSDESLVPPDYSWEALQLRSPPPFPLVLKHLQSNMWRTESSLYTIEKASVEVLKYLDKIWETLSSSDILELQQLSFIAADNGTRLASPDTLFTRLTLNLSPLASILPSCYLPFIKILKALGVHDMLSTSLALNILSSLHKSFEYYRLNPNEHLAVIELLEFLCEENINLQTSDRPIWESQLLVPDDHCRLVPPKTCVYIDPHGSQYVNYIDSSMLRFVHPDVSEKLCLAFGIRKLSNVIVEEVEYVEHLQTLEEVGSISLIAIKQKLLSLSFQVAVASIVNNIFSIMPGYKNPDFETLKRSLESVAKRLTLVQCIYTRFWLLPKFLDVTRATNESLSKRGSSHQALYYVDRLYTCMLISERPNCVSTVDRVAFVVSHVLGSPVPLAIGSLFLCPQGFETSLVNVLKLSSVEKVMEGVSSGVGFLGKHLLPRDEEKVDFVRTATLFCKEEIVAWQSREGRNLKYGRIPKDVMINPSEDETTYRLQLETSPGTIRTVINSNVFQFQNFATTNDYFTLGIPVQSYDMVSNMQVHQPEGSQGLNLRNQRDASKEVEPGRVPSEVFVQSIEELLSVSGINMDIEKQCLLQKTLSLQEQLSESQATLILEQENSDIETRKAMAAKKDLQTALQCRICLTSEMDTVLIACGHVMCHTCTSDVTLCPICGVKFSRTMKLYRP